MSKLIGGIYELKEQIGSGGGSIVYIGWHTNLKKAVVLKADKRSLKASEDVLRREVDMLKNLSNTYIPQVYDFIEQDGIVYTVMEYIEGRSFEDLIEKGEKFYQSDVIRWACQALNALDYLHSQPPYGILHGDIKPANIMLRDNGDICLIDYNIALALGEDGAVQVGYSRGYASPEHYGISYLENGDTETFEISNTILAEPETVFARDEDTAKDSSIQNKKKNRIKLDVRSDIYSLGATLYHLISGQRPAIDAPKVVKLEGDICSSALASIITKSMHPVIDKRFQTSAEMLQAFLNLYKEDKRSIKYIRDKKIALGIVALTALLGITSSAIGLKRQAIKQEKLVTVEYSKNALQEGNISQAVRLALDTLPDKNGIFNISAGSQGQKALTDALGVYNLSSSFENDSKVDLPSSTLKIVKSSYNSVFAYVYYGGAVIYDTNTKKELTRLELVNNAKAGVYFLANNKILYTGINGISLYDLESRQDIWTKNKVSEITVSKDENIVAGVDGKMIYIYDTKSGEKLKEISLDIDRNLPVNNIFADNKSDIFELNSNGSMLVLSFEDGSVKAYPTDIDNPREGEVVFVDTSDYRIFSGGFCDNYFTFTASKAGESIVAAFDMESLEQALAYKSENQTEIKIIEEKIFICDGHIVEHIDLNEGKEDVLLYLPDKNIVDFEVNEKWIAVTTDDNKATIYSMSGKKVYEIKDEKPFFDIKIYGTWICTANRDDTFVRVIKNDNNESAISMTYNPTYSHNEARVSADSNRLILFSIYGMQILDNKGNILSEIEFPDKNNIYDQQYRRPDLDTNIFSKNISGDIKSHISNSDLTEGKSWLEVFWYDGTVRKYDDKDGHLIAEYQRDAPNKELYEEFSTNDYKVISSLHKAPEIYSKKTNKLLKVLENEDYLTYVSQIDGMLLLEYVRASVATDAVQIKERNNINGMIGVEKYGVLMNNNFEEVANIPGLCDHINDVMYFDDALGIIRKTEILSLQKLKDIARKSLEE